MSGTKTVIQSCVYLKDIEITCVWCICSFNVCVHVFVTRIMGEIPDLKQVYTNVGLHTLTHVFCTSCFQTPPRPGVGNPWLFHPSAVVPCSVGMRSVP